MTKFLLIDGSNVLHRAYHALPPLTNSAGRATNGVYGFIISLQRILEQEQPTHVAICFDRGKNTFRHRLYDQYKAQRKPTDAALVEQFPLCEEALKLNGFLCLDSDEFEADDIIGSLARIGSDSGAQVVIFSGDKDLLQLIDKHVTVCCLKKGTTNLEMVNEEVFRQRYDLAPARLVDLKALMGDASDNIPGVTGVGEKTALKLLHEYGTLDNVYAHLDDMAPSKIKERLQNDKEKAYLSYTLATIRTDMTFPFTLDDLRPHGKDFAALKELYGNLEFRSLLKTLTAEEAEIQAEGSLFGAETDKGNIDYTKIDATAFVTAAKQDGRAALICDRDIFYGGLADGRCTRLHPTVATDIKALAELLNGKTAILGHNLKCADHFCFGLGNMPGFTEDDLEIMAYLLNPSASGYRMAQLLEQYCHLDVGSGEETGLAAAVAAFQLEATLRDHLQKNDMLRLYEEIERPLERVLAAMEHEGIRVDREILRSMSNQLNTALTTLTAHIHELAGEEFNINSPKQLSHILFEKLGLPKSKKTKTGYATGSEVLEELTSGHEIIGEILHYRTISKLKSTYTDALAKLISPTDGHIHTCFKQTVTTTGRLSSADPNLQNIPVRLEEGRLIRKAFLPRDQDHVLLSADYSQIELRLLAHYADDPALTESFLRGEDIHERTAREIFNVPNDQELPHDLRRRAKAVNFGIIYGISDYGLARDIGVSRQEAGDYITRYFARYPKIEQYLTDTVAEAKRLGYVTTLFKRRRYLPDLHSRNFNVRSFAERTAMNTPLQGSAADIIKGVMVALDRELTKQGLKARLILQVHDELIVDCPLDEKERVLPLMRQIMEDTYTLRVPLIVDMKQGQDWYNMQPVTDEQVTPCPNCQK